MPGKLSVTKNPQKRTITGGHSANQLGEQIRELRTKVPVMIPIESIPVLPEFENLFPIKDQNLDSIAESIRVHGFDEKFAVIIGVFPDGSSSLVAGFTRRRASIVNQMKEIPAWSQEFESVDSALDWALHEQLDRRNLTEAEVYEYVLRIDQITGKGKQADGYTGKSSQRTADIVGVSASKVDRIRSVEKGATEEEKEAIRTGQKSVNRVHKEIKERRKASSDANSENTPKDWTVEKRGAGISLIRGDDVISLVSLKTMDLMYNGAPYEQIRKAVEKYMEKVL